MEIEEMLEQTNDTENTENQTVEEIDEGIELTDTAETEPVEEKEEVRTFTQEEVDEIVQKRLARTERNFKKELSKYKNVESVLNAGLGTHNIDEVGKQLRSYYQEQGIDIPESSSAFDEEELKILGRDDANQILALGIDEAAKEANLIASKDRSKWSPREQATFDVLASALNRDKQVKELKSIGADTKIVDSEDFKKFVGQFLPTADIKMIYKMYSKSENKEKPAILGSMKNNTPEKIQKKYTEEEINSLDVNDLINNDKLWEQVRKSMTGQI